MSQIKSITSPATLRFKVRRGTSKLIAPVSPTPHELKPLSDLDQLDGVRTQVPIAHFFPHNPSMNGVDPVNLIRKAIAQTLVFYYPFAGRLREGPSGKLIVECTGEGILFTEADADVTLDQFGHPLVPPFPCFDQLLFDVPGSSDILNCPLMLIQVTRLKCKGFIFSIRLNHTMSDARGLVQFLFAVGEIARGATCPSVLPTWERHILNFPNSQKLSFPLPKYNNDVPVHTALNDMASLVGKLCNRGFVFSPTEISVLRAHVPPHLRHCTSFEIIAASVWKCRVIALQPHPTQEMSFVCTINLRSKLNDLIPAGCYGNAIVFSTVKSTTKEIIENPLSYTLQLVQNAKNKVNNVESFTEPVVNTLLSMTSYTVTDLRHARFKEVDFGWGNAEYAGLAIVAPMVGFHLPFTNENGEIGIMLPLCLPEQVMERFEIELNNMLNDNPFTGNENAIVSKL